MEPVLPNRKQRRRNQARNRCLIQKHTPFGRVRVVSFEDGPLVHDDRTIYMHLTRGLVDRRTTTQLLNNLISVG